MVAQRWKYVLDLLVSISMKRIPNLNTAWSTPFHTTSLVGNLLSVLHDYSIAIKSTLLSMFLIIPHETTSHISQHGWHFKKNWYYKYQSWLDKCWHILYAWPVFPRYWMWSCIISHLTAIECSIQPAWCHEKESLVPWKFWQLAQEQQYSQNIQKVVIC